MQRRDHCQACQERNSGRSLAETDCGAEESKQPGALAHRSQGPAWSGALGDQRKECQHDQHQSQRDFTPVPHRRCQVEVGQIAQQSQAEYGTQTESGCYREHSGDEAHPAR